MIPRFPNPRHTDPRQHEPVATPIRARDNIVRDKVVFKMIAQDTNRAWAERDATSAAQWLPASAERTHTPDGTRQIARGPVIAMQAGATLLESRPLKLCRPLEGNAARHRSAGKGLARSGATRAVLTATNAQSPVTGPKDPALAALTRRQHLPVAVGRSEWTWAPGRGIQGRRVDSAGMRPAFPRLHHGAIAAVTKACPILTARSLQAAGWLQDLENPNIW